MVALAASLLLAARKASPQPPVAAGALFFAAPAPALASASLSGYVSNVLYRAIPTGNNVARKGAGDAKHRYPWLC